MKRKMTLAGSLLALFAGIATIISAIVSLSILFVEVAQLMQEMASQGTNVDQEGMIVVITSCVLIGIPMVFVAVSSILNLVSATAWKKEPQAYKKFKGVIIATIVFNFIGFVCAYIIGGVVGYLAGIVMAAGAALLIVDLALESKRVRRANKEEVKIVESQE